MVQSKDDPFVNDLAERITLVEHCARCHKTTGCLVIIEKRLVEFRDECWQCEHKNLPSCKACCTVRIAEVPGLCESCKQEVS
jgi:hypothetical protein